MTEAEITDMRERLARLETAFADTTKCPRCTMTRMECADVIAEFEVERPGRVIGGNNR
jgi:hypothetical protein